MINRLRNISKLKYMMTFSFYVYHFSQFDCKYTFIQYLSINFGRNEHQIKKKKKLYLLIIFKLNKNKVKE